VQRDHLHLVVEAANRDALSRALHALASYHMRILKTPTEVKNALRYVLRTSTP